VCRGFIPTKSSRTARHRRSSESRYRTRALTDIYNNGLNPDHPRGHRRWRLDPHPSRSAPRSCSCSSSSWRAPPPSRPAIPGSPRASPPSSSA
jgi:hypothetical protein